MTARSYRQVLSARGEVVEMALDGLDRLGVPVTSCSLVVGGRIVASGNGYGADRAAAELSGLGELAEGVLAGEHVSRLRARTWRGSWRELVARLGRDQVVDPRTLTLPAGSSWTEEAPLDWLPATRVRTGEEVWLPAELLASEDAELPPGPRLLPPITNGLGAGTDPVRPLTHGLLELLQRHTNVLRFRALDRLSPEITADALPASVAALVQRMSDLGVRPVLKHAGTELGVVSTYVTGEDEDPPQPVVVTACGEAAHPSAEVSLTKAVLEFANSRARKAFCFGDPVLARRTAPDRYWDALPPAAGDSRERAAMQAWAAMDVDALARLTRSDRSRRVSYAEVGGLPAPTLDQPTLLEHLLSALEADPLDHDVLAATTSDGPVVVSKVVVTNLEAETLSHSRIGETGVARSIAADLDLVRVQDRASATHSARVLLTEEAEQRLGGPVWWSPARAEELLGPLYPLYREPPRHSVALT
ncbi:YcaO-like family protein [Desertihabitans aurantiacus]|uniref:YcaO-like family protein n=1 Tax=Desertihabitans aurantiacus TaxID=2282477 RepID=UPI001300475F|nr:YcaO-like family protein [Desertihabitans aurantiacus]